MTFPDLQINKRMPTQRHWSSSEVSGGNKSQVSILKYKMKMCLHFISTEMAGQNVRPSTVWLTVRQP